METRLHLDILPQPDDLTCGPTCLHAVYRYYGDEVPLEQVIAESRSLEEGGTLAVFLGCHALKRGYRATMYTYNLDLFDPTWFGSRPADLTEKLTAQREAKTDPRLRVQTPGYLEFLRLGGRIRFADLTSGLLRRYLSAGVPILTGLSATYLYHTVREYGFECVDDDVRGFPAGHFVVVSGYDRKRRRVLVADPHERNPLTGNLHYEVDVPRLIGSILLGIVTHDANLLILEKS